MPVMFKFSPHAINQLHFKKRVNTLERKVLNQLPATKTIQLKNYKSKQRLQHNACSFLFLQQVSAKSKCRGYPRYIGKSQFTLEHRRVSARTVLWWAKKSRQHFLSQINPQGGLDNSQSHSANVFRVDDPRSEPRVLHELTQKKMAEDAESDIAICFVNEYD